MAGHRFGDPLNDADIDRVLASALAVEPSPAFLARVRMRIASEPEPSAWWLPSMFAAACGSAIAVAIAITVTNPDQTSLRPHPARISLPAIASAPLTAVAPLAFALSAARRARHSTSETPTPEMRAIMNSSAEASTALAAHGREKNYDAIVKDAATFRQNLAYIQAFWANKQMDEPLAIASSGLEAVAALQAAALAKDDAAIESAIAALTATCVTCHRQYREQLPDKTYEIRL